MATPTAFGAFVQCLCGSLTDMLMRLDRLLVRQEGGHRDTRERHKEDGLQSPSQEINGSWKSTVSNGQGIEGFLKEEGFS